MLRITFLVFALILVKKALSEENVLSGMEEPPHPRHGLTPLMLERNRKRKGSSNDIAKDKVENWKPGDGDNVWERSGFFEGDIMLTKKEILHRTSSKIKLWPNATVPYYIDNKTINKTHSDEILRAISVFHNKTCVRFRPTKSNDKNFLWITSAKSGCWSYVGQKDKGQVVNFHPTCLRFGTVLHELMHSLGFHHQQSAPERDEWVKIIWDNILDNHVHNFEKYEDDKTGFGLAYDYGSILHYSPIAFSKDSKSKRTIIPLVKNVSIGQRFGLSEKDIKKINLLYKCNKQ